MEAAMIRKAMERAGGTIVQAATLLGLHRDTLVAKMRKFGIER